METERTLDTLDSFTPIGVSALQVVTRLARERYCVPETRIPRKDQAASFGLPPGKSGGSSKEERLSAWKRHITTRSSLAFNRRAKRSDQEGESHGDGRKRRNPKNGADDDSSNAHHVRDPRIRDRRECREKLLRQHRECNRLEVPCSHSLTFSRSRVRNLSRPPSCKSRKRRGRNDTM